MILSGLEIRRRLGTDIEIEPFDARKLNPNSYNVTLHDELMTYRTDSGILDMKCPSQTEIFPIPPEGYVLEPGRLYLGRTAEFTWTKNLVPMLEGRSSVGRLGVFIHATAGFGDVGFEGFWTLELSCVQPVRIYPGVEIGQLYYHTIEGSYEPYRSGKYQNNTGIQPSLMHMDFWK